MEPGTITGLEDPVRPELVRGATNVREVGDEPAPVDPDKVPPLPPYIVGR